MEPLIIEQGDDTPLVHFDKKESKFLIEGSSFPENPFELYGKLFSWLEKYCESPNSETNLQFKLNYINTASSKQIIEVITLLEKISHKSKIKIIWHYEKEDDDALLEGKDIELLFNLEFDYVED